MKEFFKTLALLVFVAVAWGTVILVCAKYLGFLDITDEKQFMRMVLPGIW